jgi:hypothetical protein
LDEVRDIILELSRNLRHNLNLGYVTPCLFTDQELLSMGFLTFHNVFYLYHLADNSKTDERLWEISDYRRQVPTKACKSCQLASEKMCGGILKRDLG